MKWYRIFLGGTFLLFCSGCFWPFGPAKSSSSHGDADPHISVEILRADLLAKGGKLVFIPFTAGMNAEAGPKLDRLSLMIVKGASDAFRGDPATIRMVDQGDPDQGDFILEGHVEEFRTVEKRMFGIRKRPGLLVVQGAVRDRRTNESLVLIFGRREFREVGTAEALAYDFGRQMAEGLIVQERKP